MSLKNFRCRLKETIERESFSSFDRGESSSVIRGEGRGGDWSSASGVTRVGVTRCDTSGCHPNFLPSINWRPFLLAPVIFIAFTRVSPPPLYGVTHTFLPLRPRFSTLLCKFSHTKKFLRVSPPWRVSPGAVRPTPAPIVTPLMIGHYFQRCLRPNKTQPSVVIK